MSEEPLPRPKCEGKDAPPSVPALLAGSMAAIVAVCLISGLLIAGRTTKHGTELSAEEGLFQHGPQAKTDIDRAWDTLDPTAGSPADRYAWIDRRAGIVQVPIDRAIDLICAEQTASAGSTSGPAPK
jgi:hypothetical protein